ncbi:MAG: ATP-binding cassette domain-containing protein [Geminicoccaceae bacterium]
MAATATSSEVILTTRRLTVRFGGLTAVGELDLAVAPHAIHGIIGPNGAGKTTVFNCIMQNLQISGGEIWFCGERIDGLTPDRIAALGISRTYQNIRLFRNLTAIENLLVGMHLHLRSRWWEALINLPHTRHDEKRAHAEAVRLLQLTGLRGRGDVLARNLSYGEQRRLEIGRALATRPKLLMLDEPTAGMNPRETSDMMAFIRKVRKTFGITILLIEHQMRVVMGVCDRITVLDQGSRIAEGTPAEIRLDPKVQEAYLGSSEAARPARCRPRLPAWHDSGSRLDEAAMSSLEVDDINVFYGNIQALKGVSLTIRDSQIVALVGANGAGKTTILHTISGLLRPKSGDIRLLGRSLVDVEPHEIARLGVMQVPEGRRIFSRLTVEENLAMGAFVRNDRGEIAADRERVLTLFPRLGERLKQVAGTLSGGEQQMLATARALMGRPRVLLMDEPSMGLSLAMAEQVLETIRAINAQGVTILLVEQNVALALCISDHAYVIESGRIVLSGRSKDLLGHEEVQRAYLG